MKKLIGLVVAILLISSGVVFGAEIPFPASNDRNIIIESALGGNAKLPTTIIKKVRYGRQGADFAKLNSGDVVSWDGLSADGVTISACITSQNSGGFAGVLVTDILTTDTQGDNWGYMAVGGYCLARVDTSEATTMHRLVVNGTNLVASFGTEDQTEAWLLMSEDIGLLLSDSGSDGLMPIILKRQ